MTEILPNISTKIIIAMYIDMSQAILQSLKVEMHPFTWRPAKPQVSGGVLHTGMHQVMKRID